MKILAPTHTKVKWLQWILHLSLIPAIIYSEWYLWLLTIVTFWLVHGLGSGIGTHRYYTHRTFETNKFWQIVMSFFFTISCTGSTIGYTLMHIKHHKNSDKENDPHKPEPNFWKTWWGVYDETKLTFAPKIYMKLMKDSIMRFFHEYYFGVIICYAIVLSIIDPILVVFMFALPAIMQFHMNGILIALVHSPKAKYVGGYRNYETDDESHNIWWLKPLALGEELHNNHHAKPYNITMNHGHGWKDFDPLYYVIKYIIRGKQHSAD